MNKRFVNTIIAICATFAGCVAQSKNDVMKTMELANDYFINKYPDAGAPTFVKKMRPSNLWTRGVYFEGLMALTELERQTGGDKYDVYYRVHCQNFGWMDWAKNGESAGSAGYSYRTCSSIARACSVGR